MHFDDRLATVLRLPATSRAIARIQFRQLIDLLGRGYIEQSSSDMREAALARLDELAALIPAAERAALLREPMMRLAHAELVARLVTAESDVAIAAIGAADLSDADWLELIPALPVRARGILRHRRGFAPEVEALLERLGIGDRGLPPMVTPPSATQVSERPQRPELVVLEGGAGENSRRRPREEPSTAGIGAIVRRIEAFRTARTGENGEADATPVANGSAAVSSRTLVLALDFTTDDLGRVDWAEGPLAPGLVGRLLGETRDEPIRQAIRQRQPLREATLVLSGAPGIAGEWRLDALPRFGGTAGRFVGYAGRLRRLPPQAEPAAALSSTADSMREVLHELRTPANAIQVAAEIIQQQLYGPAPHEYRALAAAIAGDTAQILAGFEELDRLVRLEAGTLFTSGGECDLGKLVCETVDRLNAWTTPRDSGFHLPDSEQQLTVGLDHEEAARLVWRLLAAIAGVSRAGEITDLALSTDQTFATLTIDVPPALAERFDQAAAGQPLDLVRSLSAGIFGVGFTLRLAAAEAAAAGGRLVREGARFSLILPGLTLAAAGHTQA
jgi:signal transduction histidine kinase